MADRKQNDSQMENEDSRQRSGGQFKKGSQRAREAGRKGGKASR